MHTTGFAAAGPHAGDEDRAAVAETFDAFARRERRPLTAYAWSLTGDLAAAEDLVQDALEATWRNWHAVRGLDRPGAWARRVVGNRAVDRGRRAGREVRALARLAARTPAKTMDLEPDDDRFWAEVRKLPERQRQAVALHYLEDLSIDAIAEAIGCAPPTVRVHLHRGRLALAAALATTHPEEDR
jgi:RNA polymerase sigma-70 factor (ECF subfamily)